MHGRIAASTIDDFRAYNADTQLHLHAVPRILAGLKRQRAPAAHAGAHQERPAEAQERQARHHPRQQWLDQNQPVEQMTWCPGLPMLIRDRLVVDGGWIERKGVTCFNLYRPPRIELGDATKPGPGSTTCARSSCPGDAAHIINWLAHRVQQPQREDQPCSGAGRSAGSARTRVGSRSKHAVGPWNFHEVSPGTLLGRFNGFAKSVILRVNEARDLGDVERSTALASTITPKSTPPPARRAASRREASA